MVYPPLDFNNWRLFIFLVDTIPFDFTSTTCRREKSIVEQLQQKSTRLSTCSCKILRIIDKQWQVRPNCPRNFILKMSANVFKPSRLPLMLFLSINLTYLEPNNKPISLDSSLMHTKITLLCFPTAFYPHIFHPNHAVLIGRRISTTESKIRIHIFETIICSSVD